MLTTETDRRRQQAARRTTASQRLLSSALAAALAAGLLVPAAALAATSAANPSERYFEQARQAVAEGDLALAVTRLKNALRSDPENVTVRLELARVLLLMRDGASAEKELKAGRRHGLSREAMLEPLAQAYAAQDKQRAIIDEIDAGQAKSPLAARLLVARGRAWMKLQEPGKAADSFQAAANRDLASPLPWMALAELRLAGGDSDAAEVAVDRALAIAPDDLLALLQKADIRRARGDMPGALTYFDRAATIDPASSTARLGRAQALLAGGQDDRADADVDSVLGQSPGHPVALYMRALIAARAGRLAEAMTTLTPALPALDSFPQAHYLMATLTLKTGDPVRAQAYVDQYRDRRPDDAAGRRLAAAIQLRNQAPEQAVALLLPLVEANRDDLRAVQLLASAYLMARDDAAAAEWLERAGQLDPNSPAARRLAAGSATADSQIDAIPAGDPDDAQAAAQLLLARLRAGDDAGAAEAARRLAVLMPDSPLPDYYLGVIGQRQNDMAAARGHYAAALERNPALVPALLAMARIEAEGRRLDEAKLWYRQVLAVDDDRLDAAVGLTSILIAEGRLDEAHQRIGQTMAAHPEAREPRRLLVETLLRQRREAEALAAAGDLLRRAPDDPAALLTMGRAQMASGHPGDAAVTYGRLTGISPKAAAGQLGLGQALFAAGDIAAARLPLERAVALAPETLAAKLLLAEVLFRTGDPDTATEVAQHTARDHPQDASAKVALGDLYGRTGRYDEAAAVYEAALRQLPDAATLRRYHVALTHAGRAEEARRVVEDWLERRPDDADTRFFLAGELMRQGDYGAAAGQYETLRADHPERAVLWNNLAWLYGALGDERALAYAEKAVELQPDSAQIVDTLGWLLVERGDTERALPLLARAWAQAAGNPSIGYHYAEALARAGQAAEAAATLRGLVAANRPFEERQVAENLLRELEQR